MVIFKDRQSAGKLLAERLKDIKADLVLGIPRGGVMVAYEISKYLNLPLDVIITRKIGAPNQPELALGAVDPDGIVVGGGIKIEDELKEIRRREELYRRNRQGLDIKDKIVIVADDGIATGFTVISALKYLKRHGAREVILAVPVASRESLNQIGKDADEMEVLYVPEDLGAVGQFYQSFESVRDEEVVQLLNNG